MEQNSTRCHSSAEQDTLYIETEKAEFEIIYRLCLNQQGRKNVVYELKTSDDSSIDFVQSYMVNGIRKLDCFLCMIMWQMEIDFYSMIMKVGLFT